MPRVSKTRERISAVFTRETRALSPRKVSKLAGVNPNTTRGAVQALTKMGKLVMAEGRGKYRLKVS